MSASSKKIYDLCVIGCGAGGFTAAVRAVDLGKNVCIIEGGQIGGAAVKWGALASKTLWELAKDYAIARKKDRGYKASSLQVDYREVKNTVNQAVKEKQDQMRLQIEALSLQNNHRPGRLCFLKGMASFITPQKVQVSSPGGEKNTVTAMNFIIATGSTPRTISGFDVDQKKIFDSDGILSLKEFPKRLMIIGAGIVGCEYATIFSNFKQTKVCLIDHMDRVIPYEDEDVSDFVSRNLASNGVQIIHSARVKNIEEKTDQMVVAIENNVGDIKQIPVDAVLVSVGREPNTSDLRLNRIGIFKNENGNLSPDRHCRVSENIYAVGDVTPHPNLVNIAEMEAGYAVKHMCGIRQGPLNYRNMSTVMFFYPAVAAVGINEKNCREKKIPYRVAYYANALLSRAIAMRATNGFVKIIVGEKNRKILGMRAGGPQVSSTIMSITYLMDLGRDIENILESVHPHPTMSEGIQGCLRLLLGESVYKEQTFPQFLKIRTWYPGK